MKFTESQSRAADVGSAGNTIRAETPVAAGWNHRMIPVKHLMIHANHSMLQEWKGIHTYPVT